jgi:RNA polymerase sigma factor (sigma-70 family)
MARILHRYLPPGMGSDDLISVGTLGLIAAVDNHDPEKGRLGIYASHRIQGAMRDAIRKLTGRAGGVSRVWLDMSYDDFSLRCMDERAGHPDAVALVSLEKGLALLPARWAEVMRLYYFEQRTMLEISRVLGLNEPRISQIHKAAIKKLRAQAFTPAHPRGCLVTRPAGGGRANNF